MASLLPLLSLAPKQRTSRKPTLLTCAAVVLLCLPLPAAAAKGRDNPVSVAAGELLDAAVAAREAGDPERELALLEEGLATLDASASYPVLDRMRQNLGERGILGRAVGVAERELRAARTPAEEHHVLVNLVNLYAGLHQHEKAAQALGRLELLMQRLRSLKGWERKGLLWQAGLARAKAAFHTKAGHLAQAEDAWKACLSSTEAMLRERTERSGGAQYVSCIAGLIDVQIATGQLAAAGASADQLRTSSERLVELKSRPGLMVGVDAVLGRLAVQQGRPVEARRIYTRALAALQSANAGDDSLRAASLRLQLALLDMLEGRWDSALTWHRQRAEALLRAGEGRGNNGANSVEYAYTLLRLGRSAEALEMLDKSVAARSEIYDANSLYLLESHAFRGIALAAAGRREEALGELRTAIPAILEIMRGERSSAEAGVLRTARMNWMLDGYLSLLADVAADATSGASSFAIDEAFRMADLARGGTVQRALAASSSRASISDPALAEIARREQDLQREISSLSESIGNLLVRGRIAEQDKVVADMRATLAKLRAEHATAQAEIERRFPDYAALLTPKPVGIAGLQTLLKPTEAVIAVYAGSERSMVWAVRATGAPVFAIVPLSSEQLDLKVQTLRQALDPTAEEAGRLPRFRFDIAHELYRKLLAPVESGWLGAEELIVIPHGRLGQLPFGVLTTAAFVPTPAKLAYAEMAAAPWLIKQLAISQLPAAVVLPALRSASRGRPAPRAFIGFGDPVFAADAPGGAGAATRGSVQRRKLVVARQAVSAPGGAEGELALPINFKLLPQLPDTAAEIEEVAGVLAAVNARDVYLHRRASEALVKQADLVNYRVVMFATHGLMNGEMPGLYQPALALSNPAITGDGEDGMLTMEEVLGLKLNADWVVLSACNSAAAGGASGESVSGLGRAFFYAGAKSLLVTNWAVETESARMLTTEAFRRQAASPGLSRAQALQQSALALMKKAAGSDYSYAHPMFWAPYSIIGDGG